MTFKIKGQRYKLTPEGRELVKNIESIALLVAFILGLWFVSYANRTMRAEGLPWWMWVE